jgi:hypothetical protein
MQHRRPRFSEGGEGPHRHRGRPRGRRQRHRRPGGRVDIGWKVHSFVRRTDTTRATPDLDDLTQALVRRNALGDDKYVSGIDAGTEVFKGSGRPDTVSRSVGVG